MIMDQDYGIERALAQRAPELHRRYRDCVVISQRMLCHYENYFPDFTDHTVLHTLDILNLCNQLIGGQMEALSVEDLYVLSMGALLHDVGMGVSVADFELFRAVLGFPEPADDTARAWAVRGLSPGVVRPLSGEVLADAGLAQRGLRPGCHPGLPGPPENGSSGSVGLSATI